MLKPVEKIKAYAVRQPRRSLSMVSAKLMPRSQGFDSPLTDSFASYLPRGCTLDSRSVRLYRH